MPPRRKRVETAEATPQEEQIAIPGVAITDVNEPDSSPKAFTKQVESAKPITERVSIALNPDGTIQWDAMREGTKTKVKAMLESDPQLRLMVTGSPVDARIIQPKHVEGLLKVVELAERLIWPKVIESKTEGKIKANPAIAAQVFAFTDGEKKEISEPGSVALDQHLPMQVKQWIASTGPAGEALAALAKAEERKVKMYATMALMAGAIKPQESDSIPQEMTQ